MVLNIESLQYVKRFLPLVEMTKSQLCIVSLVISVHCQANKPQIDDRVCWL